MVAHNKIVYLQQRNYQWQSAHGQDSELVHGKDVLDNYLGKAFYARCGLDTWPWRFEDTFWHTRVPETRIPDLSSADLDFSSITDSTAVDLRKRRFDRPWYIDWSGGIDSTVILVAIMKQFDRADYENITVLLNATSVWENPDFFTQQIQPNFRYVNTEEFNQELCRLPHYRIHGDPADMLWGASKGLQAKKDGVDLKRPWRCRDPEWMRFNSRLFGPESAEWIYQHMSQNIDSVPQYSIESVADWYWWLNFNFKWIQKMVYDFGLDTKQTATEFFDSILPWYAQPIYQQWSIAKGRFSLVTGGVETYKTEAKDYIFAWDKNAYYRQFKTKFDSSAHSLVRSKYRSFWALTDQLVLMDHNDLCLEPGLIDSHRNIL